MRKLYGFLLALLVLGAVSSGVAQAQTYAITDYLVRTANNSGPSYQEITGTHIANLEATNYQIYYQLSGPIQVPFNFRFLNQQFTTSSTFQINGAGDVFFSPTWSAGTNNYPDYDAYYYYFYMSNSSTHQGYIYPYEAYYNEADYTSYGYYPNFKLSPNAGYHYQYPAVQIADVEWTVLGSAPNRQLVVQFKNFLQNYYYYNPTLASNFQSVVYEGGISSFQFNYGRQVGTISTNAYSGWGYNYGGYYGYGTFCGIKADNGQNLSLGWYGSTSGGINDANFAPNASVAMSTGQNPKWGYNLYGSGEQYYLDNNGVKQNGTGSYCTMNCITNLPSTSYRIFIAYPYDLTAGLISAPADQSIQNLGSVQQPTVTLTNSGTVRPTSAVLQFQISLAGTGVVYNQSITLSSAQLPAPFQTITIGAGILPTFTVPSYGIYTDTVIVYNLLPTADQNPVDNSSNNSWTCSPPNNIKAVTILGPAPGTRSPVAVNTPISIRFRNIGSADQYNVPLTVVVTDPSGAVVYRDTVVKAYLPSPNTSIPLSTLDTTFNNWTPAVNGNHKVCGIAIMTTDQLHADDTTCATIGIRYEADVAANSIVNPIADEEKPYTLQWQPAALFQSIGVSDLFDVPARVQIRRCSDGQLVFQADSIIPELNVDQNLVRFQFPSHQGPYDISRLTPGCYNICAIARYPTDGDRSSDTACSSFSIIDRLKGNIFVGVGQRFQSIHAAVDSMVFRGVGGNLNLILTDANYTENGTYRVSNPQAALNFNPIRGLSDTSWVTWIPKQGVTPTIAFTGNKPFCFYFGDLMGGHIKFEGYNPLGVPIPDKLVAEPNKRGITIIDNSTAAGGVFGVELGASNLIFKDLRLVGNGKLANSSLGGGTMFANDSSAVIRMYNEQNRNNYIARILDTVQIHNIRVENCEIGNAKYGLYDHGLHDQFELGPSSFKSWKNFNNVVTRNTIGTSTNPISYAGISFQSERNMTISHNEISNIDDSLTLATAGYTSHAYGIMQPSGNQITQPGTIQDSIGNVAGIWIDGNRIHNIRAWQGNAYGVAIQQAATIYSTSGAKPVVSTLPSPTRNVTSNNMLYDFRIKSGAAYPIVYMTASTKYSADRDSIFNNSISTSNAAVDITVQNAAHAFIWNNVIQNTGKTGSYTNFALQLTRPYANALSSDYNLFDLRAPGSPSVATFATITEYDGRPTLGTIIQTRTFRKLNDWRTYNQMDIHSQTGDPMFAADTAHMPGAFSYVSSPASNNGAWLGTASQLLDFDGDSRQTGNGTPDIGADEFEGFQYSNDLAVLSINNPGGYSQKSDTSLVTLENPMYINATVKNLSAQAVFNRTVKATVEVALSGGPWQTLWSSTTSLQNWDVNESRNVTFTGPTLTPVQSKTGVFRVTVWVPTDQNHVNDSLSKVFATVLKTNATLVSYNGATLTGRMNRDSVYGALARLGITGYDTLDRNTYGAIDLDYTPYWTMIWASGDPTIPVVSGQPTGQAGLSFKETQEVERFLKAGQTYAKKSLIMAGQNIAFQNGFAMPNNVVTDTEFTNTWMHTTYVANTPVAGSYSGTITGRLLDYNSFPDNLNCASPDVVKPAMVTPTVGSEVNWWAYSYNTHPQTPSDSGAGTTYRNPLYNTVFYGFDWMCPIQTTPGEVGTLTSGVTRVMRGALDFVASHAGTILAVDFVSASAPRIGDGTTAMIKWTTARQEDVARYDVETRQGNAWVNVGQVSASKESDYHFAHDGLVASKSYTYRIAAVDQSGAKTYSNEIESAPLAATGFTLEQNYPNPASGMTTVHFTLPVSATVSLRLLDVTGKVVATEFANEAMQAGQQVKSLDVTELASGSYIYELTAVDANGQTVTLSKKMTLSK